MIYTFYTRFVVLSAIMMIGLTLSAQKTIESVILYNGQPVRAIIDDKGNIIKIVSAVPDFLSPKELDVPIYDKDIRNVAITPNEETPSNVAQNISSKHIQNPEVAINVNQDEAVVNISNDTDVIHFDKDMAILTMRVRRELDEIVNILNSNPNINILAMTLSKFDNELVSKNRFNAIISYLKLKGISENRISYKPYYSNTEASVVRIQYMDKE